MRKYVFEKLNWHTLNKKYLLTYANADKMEKKKIEILNIKFNSLFSVSINNYCNIIMHPAYTAWVGVAFS